MPARAARSATLVAMQIRAYWWPVTEAGFFFAGPGVTRTAGT